MKVIRNTTHYDTRHLKSLITATHKLMTRYEGKLKFWKRCRVAIQNSKRGKTSTSGYAYYNGNLYGSDWDVFLGLPHERVKARRVVDLIYHELMHSYGYKHTQYNDIRAEDLAEIIPEDYDIPLAASAKAAKPDIVKVRYDRLLKRETNWAAKHKRAENALRKVRRERRAYESRHGDRLAV